jgi:hypothetical protein
VPLLGARRYDETTFLCRAFGICGSTRKETGMTFVGVAGILLGFLAFAWFSAKKDNSRLALFLVMAILHIGAAYFYYLFVQNNDADTKLYYYDVYDFYEDGFGLGTMFVVYLTQSMRELFGGTYLDYFLLYQILGIWGLALLMRTMDEAAFALGTELLPAAIALLFLPGMYFWTAAIGKDAPLFFACVLSVWSCFRISSRWPWFAVAIIIMVLFRAHVALLTVLSLALALVAGRGVPTAARILLVSAALVGSVYLFATLQAALRVDISSIGSIANFVETQTATATQGVDDTLANAPFLFKLFSLLYRPLFVDADSIFGLIASFQNLLMLGVTIFLARNFRLLMELFRGSLAVRFATIHFAALYFMMAYMYYNVGLGLRQREMATPALLVVVTIVLLVRQLRTGTAHGGAGRASAATMAAA